MGRSFSFLGVTRRASAGFSTVDALIAVGLMAVTCVVLGWVVVAAQNEKRDVARELVRVIAEANLRRRTAGRKAVTGVVDEASALVSERALEPQNWSGPYVFGGADDAVSPCVLASAVPRPESRGVPFVPRGVCESILGQVQYFEESCSLSCVQEAPPLPPPPPAPAVVARPKEPEPAPKRPRMDMNLQVPSLGAEAAPKIAGCSATGCMGTSCCDPETDHCLRCPGASCCERGLGCKGTCFKDEDCTQGCRCDRPEGSSFGNCKAE